MTNSEATDDPDGKSDTHGRGDSVPIRELPEPAYRALRKAWVTEFEPIGCTTTSDPEEAW